MTEAIVIEVPGLPVPYARSGAKGSRRFTPARQRGAMADIKVMAAQVMRGRKPLEGPLSAYMFFTYPWPASWSPKKRAATYWKTSRCDLSNLQKLVEDALIGIAFSDDALIVHAVTEKRYGDRAHTSIRVYPLEAA